MKKEELLKKLYDLYKRFEENKPPLTFNRSEIDYNEGFYKGELKAMEAVCRELFGIDGDELEAKFT